MWPIKILEVSNHITGTAESEVVKFCTRVGNINSSNRMTYHSQKRRGYGHVTFFKCCRLCDAARRAGLSATAELLVHSTGYSYQQAVVLRCGYCDIRSYSVRLGLFAILGTTSGRTETTIYNGVVRASLAMLLKVIASSIIECKRRSFIRVQRRGKLQSLFTLIHQQRRRPYSHLRQWVSSDDTKLRFSQTFNYFSV